MDKEILKSKSDQRVYRTLVLDNKLECMVVSDVEAEKSSAAMSMGIGSLKDPVETQGLAHYLEHMLFMGTEKYPD